MSFKKYMKPLLIYAFLNLFLIVLVLIIINSIDDVGGNWIRFSPTNNAAYDVVYMFIMITICAIIGGTFVGYALGPLYLYAHKKIVGRKMIYGIQEKEKPDKFKKYFLKGLFPALMALNFALMFAFTDWVQTIATTNQGESGETTPMVTLLALLALMTGISMGVFSSAWFLLDAGIVYTNKEKVKDLSDPIEIRSVGGWYNYLLKGYAGISVILSFYAFFWYMYEIMEIGNRIDGMNIMFIIFYPTLPLVIAILSFPALILLDLTHNHRKKYIRKIAEKFKISEPLADPLNIG
ncbi:MAG: hypothetical protein ACFFAO_19650 [Candidatus Hermodarchaeota archaeon]